MKYSTARAMQIATMEMGQVDRIHEAEIAVGRCFFPHEIQTILGLPEIKERFGLPDTDDGLSAHRNRIEGELKRIGIDQKVPFADALTIESVHALDAEIILNKDQIVWEYSGGSRKKSNVFSRLSSFLF
jgi:hypothetical protein